MLIRCAAFLRIKNRSVVGWAEKEFRASSMQLGRIETEDSAAKIKVITPKYNSSFKMRVKKIKSSKFSVCRY